MNNLVILRRDLVAARLSQVLLLGAFLLFSVVFFQLALGASTSTFSQAINEGTLSVDIVDANGSSVSSPTVSFPAYTTAFSVGTSTATFGTSSEKVRVSNPTQTATWSLTFAPTGTEAIWYRTTGGAFYGYKSADNSTGTMHVNPSTGTLAGVSSCSTSNVSLGSAGYYSPTTLSRTLASASSGAETFCRWDITGITIKQEIPVGQDSGTYQIGMTVTVS